MRLHVLLDPLLVLLALMQLAAPRLPFVQCVAPTDDVEQRVEQFAAVGVAQPRHLALTQFQQLAVLVADADRFELLPIRRHARQGLGPVSALLAAGRAIEYRHHVTVEHEMVVSPALFPVRAEHDRQRHQIAKCRVQPVEWPPPRPRHRAIVQHQPHHGDRRRLLAQIAVNRAVAIEPRDSERHLDRVEHAGLARAILAGQQRHAARQHELLVRLQVPVQQFDGVYTDHVASSAVGAGEPVAIVVTASTGSVTASRRARSTTKSSMRLRSTRTYSEASAQIRSARSS